MADVIGPNTYLPGARLVVPLHQTCDNHPDRMAVARIVGETDSFGSEVGDYCNECDNAIRVQLAGNTNPGRCDWCRNHVEKRRKKRDIDEGLRGPVYDVCDACTDRANAEAEAECGEPYYAPDDYDPADVQWVCESDDRLMR